MDFINTLKRFSVFILIILAGCNIFEETEGPPNLQVNVVPTSVAGSVITSGSGAENSELQLEAIANPNWRFSHWSGDLESTDNPLSLVLSENTEVFANFVVSAAQAGIQLVVTDGAFISELRFGLIEGATDNFDSGIDLEAPPPPPSGVLYAWFEGTNRRLIHDFRNPFTSEAEWEIQVNPGGNQAISIQWKVDPSVDSSFTIFDSEGAELAELINTGSLELDLDAATNLYIRR
jgi:hypothetical protein